MRILHYLDQFDFSLGGVVQYVYQVCKSLANHGAGMTLVTGDQQDVPDAWMTPQPSPHTPVAVALSRPVGFQGWLSKSQIGEIVRLAEEHDAVHLHGPWNLGNIQIARQLFKRNIPYVVSTHGMLDDWSLGQRSVKKQLFLRALAKKFLRRAAMVHCTALAEREQVSRNVGNLNNLVCVVPIVSLPEDLPGCNSQIIYHSDSQISQTEPKLLFLSRVHVKKGLENLFDAMAILKKTRVSLQLLIAGPGEAKYIESLKARASRLGINDEILWLGMVRDPLKTALFLESDIFVLPTFQENFGIVLVEAMAIGLPVITTAGTDIWRELEKGGAVITGFSPQEIADSIAGLLEDRDALKRRGKKGQAYVRQWLDESKVIGEHLSMYERSVKARCQPA